MVEEGELGNRLDSDECLKNARDCIERANRAKTDETKSEFLLMAKAWTELAAELEKLEQRGIHPLKSAG
jgi:hypothetical protein